MLSEFVNVVVLNVAVWLWAAAALVLILAIRTTGRGLYAGLIFLLLFWISGTSPVARLVLTPLEGTYRQPRLEELRRGEITRVVVLTGGGFATQSELGSSALPHASTFRFLAGLELCQHLGPNCELIFSGSAGSTSVNLKTAETMQELALLLAPQQNVASEAASNNTAEHPQHVQPLVGSAPFALVTSAYHMPRAMSVFQREGLNAVPFPVDYYSHPGFDWTDLVPSPQNWSAINLAMHEYVGTLAYALR
jgi:uncharacterized SAM-binding protein YcdF (DUF218 family)